MEEEWELLTILGFLILDVAALTHFQATWSPAEDHFVPRGLSLQQLWWLWLESLPDTSLTGCGPWALNYIQPSCLLFLHHTPTPTQYVSVHTLPPWSLPWTSVLAFSTHFLGLRASLPGLLILPHHLKPGVPAIPVGPGAGCLWTALTCPGSTCRLGSSYLPLLPELDADPHVNLHLQSYVYIYWIIRPRWAVVQETRTGKQLISKKGKVKVWGLMEKTFSKW